MKLNFLAAVTIASLAASVSSAVAATVLSESFTYPNGSLVGAPGSPWVTTSGSTPGQVDVTTNFINITGAESEDVNAALSGSPYSVGDVTATFDLTFTALPTGTTYFAHFLNNTTTFRTKLFSTVTGAATGTYRLGITNNSNSTPATVGTDLSLNVTYSVSMSFDIDGFVSSLSVNGGTVATAVDAVPAVAINAFGFRQSTGIGTMTVDNLVVTYVPEPAAALLGSIGLLGLLRRRRSN